MSSKVWQVSQRQYLSAEGIVAILKSMSVLEWFAWLGVTSCALGVVIACDFNDTFQRVLLWQLNLTLGLLVHGFIKKPTGWALGLATWFALRIAPHNQALLMYHKRRTWMPCH